MSTIAKEPNPYIGPRPFSANEAGLFFGREREARDLVSLVMAHNLTVIYSPSGAGKTSLINTRLRGLLNKDYEAEVLPLIRVQGRLPEGVSSASILNRFVFNAITNEDILKWANDPRAQDLIRSSLAEFLRVRPRGLNSDGQPALRVLIFDQFEEIFGLHEDRWLDRRNFFEQVVQALEEDKLLRVIFAIRDDYIAQLDPHMALIQSQYFSRFRLERLRADAALEAITCPLKSTSCHFAPGEAERLVKNLLEIHAEPEHPSETTITVPGEFVEPVQLQVVCFNLWESLPSQVKEITAEHIATWGDVDQSLGEFYGNLIHSIIKEYKIDQTYLRDWISQNLITSSGTRSLVHHEQGETTSGLSNQILTSLEHRHLIRSTWYAGSRWYELTHDRFIGPIRRSNEQWRSLISQKIEYIDQQLQTIRQHVSSGAESTEKYIALYTDVCAVCEEYGVAWGEIQALCGMGSICASLGKPQDALDYYRQALQKETESGNEIEVFNILMAIGETQVSLKAYEDAKTTYQRAADLMWNFQHAPGYNFAVLRLGDVCSLQGENDKAVDAFNPVAQFYADNEDWQKAGQLCARIGQIQWESNRLDHAIEAFANAQTYYSNAGDIKSAAWVLTNLGELCHLRGDYRAAVACFSQVIELSPTNALGYEGRASAYWYAGDHARAEKDYTDALNRDPHNFNAYNGRGQVLAEMGKYEAAIEDLDIAVKFRASAELRAYSRNGRGLAYGGLKHFDRALKEFAASIEACPNNAWVYFNRAQVYEWMRQPQNAVADYQLALKMNDPELTPKKRKYARARIRVLRRSLE